MHIDKEITLLNGDLLKYEGHEVINCDCGYLFVNEEGGAEEVICPRCQAIIYLIWDWTESYYLAEIYKK